MVPAPVTIPDRRQWVVPSCVTARRATVVVGGCRLVDGDGDRSAVAGRMVGIAGIVSRHIVGAASVWSATPVPSLFAE